LLVLHDWHKLNHLYNSSNLLHTQENSLLNLCIYLSYFLLLVCLIGNKIKKFNFLDCFYHCFRITFVPKVNLAKIHTIYLLLN
jgi:hypothetical protein